MTQVLTETVPLPLRQYATLVATYCEKEDKASKEESARNKELKQQIDELMQTARSEGLSLDDECVAKSPRAAEIRKEIDKIYPEFMSRAEAAAARILMVRHFKEVISRAKATPDAVIQVPLQESLILLGVEKPNIANFKEA